MPKDDELRAALTALASGRTFDAVQGMVRRILEDLVEQGALSLGLDHQLGGSALETRVRLLLAQIGWPTSKPKDVDADLVVAPPLDARPTRPLVIEIKSGKSVGPDRGNLRQLDDWVFELSGEERARKKNVVSASVAMRGQITPSPARVHPSPHKGVFIYNGPLGTAFDLRPSSWLGPNELAFAQKRNFCIMRFEDLLLWLSAATTEDKKKEFWTVLQETEGLLRAP